MQTKIDLYNDKVRTVFDEENKLHIVAKDIAVILGYTDASNMLRIVAEEDKGTAMVQTSVGARKMNVVTPSGISSIAGRSTKPKAKELRRWIEEDVKVDKSANEIPKGISNDDYEKEMKHYLHELTCSLSEIKDLKQMLVIDKMDIVINFEINPRHIVEDSCCHIPF